MIERQDDLVVGRDRHSRALILVALIACAVQGVYLLESADDPSYGTPIIDAAVYHEAAARFANGQRLFDDAFWQPPLFPLLLGCWYRLVGVNVVLARVALAGLAAGSCVLLAGVGRRLFGARGGMWAGAALALYGPFLFFSTQLLPVGLVVFLLLAALVLWIEYMSSRRVVALVMSGICCGLAIITVPNAIVVVIAMGAVFFIPAIPFGRFARRAALAVVLGASAAMPVGAVAVRNYVVSKQFVPISTNGGINCYLGNNANTDRTLAIRPGSAWSRLARESYASGARSRAEQSAYFYGRAWTFAREEPGRFLMNLGRKSMHLLTARELPRNVDPYVHREYSVLLSALMWRVGPVAFPFSVLAPLGVCGIAAAWRRRGDAGGTVFVRRTIAVMVLAYAVTVILFFVSSRHRLPVAVLLLLFVPAGIAELAGVVRGEKHGAIAGVSKSAVTSFMVLSILVHVPVRFPTDAFNFRAELLMCAGHERQKRGRIEEAAELYATALRENPTYAEAGGRLAALWANQGNLEAAVQLARQAVAWDAMSSDVWVLLGRLLRDSGDEARAIQAFEDAVRVDPGEPNAREALAEALHRGGRTGAAIEQLRAAISVAESPGPLLIELGDWSAEAGQYEEALESYRRGLWLVEPDAETLHRVARLLVTCPDEALRDCERAIDLASAAVSTSSDPGPDIRETLALALRQCGRVGEAREILRDALIQAEQQGDAARTASIRIQLREIESLRSGLPGAPEKDTSRRPRP